MIRQLRCAFFRHRKKKTKKIVCHLTSWRKAKRRKSLRLFRPDGRNGFVKSIYIYACYCQLLHNAWFSVFVPGEPDPPYVYNIIYIINTIILVLYSNNNDINDNGEMVQFFFLSKSHAHGVKLHRSGFNRSFFVFYFVGKMAFRKNSDWRFRLPFYFYKPSKGV